MECLRLRVKDIDFSYSQICIRDGKGAKDRMTMLPAKLKRAIASQQSNGLGNPPTQELPHNDVRKLT
jgi:integrase